MWTKNNKGFSLVELLVVLAITGILIALAVGGIRIVQQVNRDTQRKALVRDMQLAIESYNEKNNDYPDLVTLDADDASCDGTMIDAEGETVCSKVKFRPSWNQADCTGYPTDNTQSEDVSGNVTGCYEGMTRAYQLYVMLERSGDDYNAGNASETD